MNFDLFDKLSELLQINKLESAIELAENQLKKLPTTKFHKVLNKDLLHLKPSLAIYLENFNYSASEYFKKTPEIKKVRFFEKYFGEIEKGIEFKPNRDLKAVYCEMNGFSINYDLWFIDLFAFDFYDGIDPKNLDWLCDFEFDSENSMIITGFEELQTAFKNYMEGSEKKDENEKNSMEICELIIILKLQELFKHTFVDNINNQWTEIPTIVASHEYELIYKVGN